MSDRTNADRLRFEAVMADRADGRDPAKDAAYDAYVEFGKGRSDDDDEDCDGINDGANAKEILRRRFLPAPTK